MSKKPESHYNLDKLHMIFAIAALIMLAAFGGLFMKDYDRSWKDYQRDFNGYEMEKTRVKHDSEYNALKNNKEYTTLLSEIEKAEKELSSNCSDMADLENEIVQLNTEYDLINQKAKFTNAEVDAAKYQFETAVGHHQGDAAATKTTFYNLKNKGDALKNDLETAKIKLDDKVAAKKNCTAKLDDLNRKKRNLSTKETLLLRKLKTIDPEQMSFITRIGNIIRDLPVIDMSNPTVKIKQVVLKDITDDRILTQVPKVDRCMTCHLGIDDPGYATFQQPFKTHPNLELYLSNDSEHPVEEFGCTVCHSGRGRGTSFNTTSHAPSSEKQKEEWEEKYDWKVDHHWEEPMLPIQNAQAGCFKCHSEQTPIKGAEKLNLGLQIIEKAGCYGCHDIKKYKDWPKAGPDLTKIASKTSKEWSYKWIQDPHKFRKNTWMPAFFNQSNNNDAASVKRSRQEIHAMVEYLFKNSEAFKLKNIPFKREPKNGEKLVSSLGCLACHQIDPKDTPTTRDSLRQQHGPNLLGLGSKTSKVWLFHWLKDPKRYHPETRMPSLRLTDQEAADIAEFLGNDSKKDFDKTLVPPVDKTVINEMTFDFLHKMEPAPTAKAKLAKMSLNEKLVYSGKKLISQYGCYACHDITGFDGAKPIGTALTEEGEKSLHKFDFGFVHIDHSKHAWFDQKLKDPRSFDKDKVKTAHDKLVMPNFELSEEEREAVVTALLGFVSERTVKNKKKARTPENLMVEKGQTLVRQLNCKGCHIMEDEGGSIQQSIIDWLVKYKEYERGEAQTIVTSFAPPNLIGEGKKVRPQWLFDFLHHPTPIRPWLNTRMPTYTYTASQLNGLLKYFTALDDEEFPFTDKVDTHMSKAEFEAGEKLFSNDYFGCAKCHIVGDKMPGGSPDSWAPNFALSKERLKPEWIIEWMMNPADLLPGTKMPTYFDPDNFDVSGPDDLLNGDEHEQIRVLRDYLMSLSENPETSPQNESTPPTE